MKSFQKHRRLKITTILALRLGIRGGKLETLRLLQGSYSYRNFLIMIQRIEFP